MESSAKRVQKHRYRENLVKKLKLELQEQGRLQVSNSSYQNISECSELDDLNCELNPMDSNDFVDYNRDDGSASGRDDDGDDDDNSGRDGDGDDDVSGRDDDGDDDDDDGYYYGCDDDDYSDDDGDDDDDDDDDLDSSLEELRRNESDNHEEEILRLRRWAVECKIPKVHLDRLLKILRARLIPNLPKCSKSFLFTGHSDYKIESMSGADETPGEFTYLGLQSGLESCVNVNIHKDNVLKLDFNIDGVKIKKSSSKTLWPILCRVFYETSPNVYKPFPVALFYGKGKPKEVDKYLKKFIADLNCLLKNGLVIVTENFKIKIRSFICDIPAKSYILQTKSHTSFNGCGKCNTVAKKENNTTVYLTLGQKRSNIDFKNFEDPDHHAGISPLISIEPEIDLVNQFVIDPMHLIFLGVNSRMFEQWMKSGTKKISASQKIELKRLTTNIKNDIPQEFKRKMRPSDEYSDYKAVEHRFFLLYCGIFVLKDILSDEMYEHFLLLHVACRMLSSPDALTYTTMAKDYLQSYVEQAPEVYQPEFVSLNVHYLNHLVDDLIYTESNLNDISAFPFETELGKIKSYLRSPHRTLAQYCRRMFEEKKVLNAVAELPKNLVIKKKTKTSGIVSVQYKNNFLSVTHPNNNILLQNGKIVKILSFSQKDDEVRITVADYKSKSLVYEKPCRSSMLDTYEITDIIKENTKREIELNHIKFKLIKFSIDCVENVKKTFVIPLLH
ncbi:hypothetical protein TKK_0015270 [Trichogramma kaykai]